jgi:hypothetical protein
MRVIQHPSSRRRSTDFRRMVWGGLFGSLIRDVRIEKGRSVQEAAAAAGMGVVEWEAVEAGQVPENWEKACQMGDALGADRMGMASLVLFCHEAWDK